MAETSSDFKKLARKTVEDSREILDALEGDETGGVDLVTFRKWHTKGKNACEDKCCCCLHEWPCPTIRLADEVELGNSAISKQIEVNSGLRDELASTTTQLNIFKRDLRKAEDRVERLEEALGFYADKKNHEAPMLPPGEGVYGESPVEVDEGKIARAALADDGKGGG